MLKQAQIDAMCLSNLYNWTPFNDALKRKKAARLQTHALAYLNYI
jgi:hypothetical protein